MIRDELQDELSNFTDQSYWTMLHVWYIAGRLRPGDHGPAGWFNPQVIRNMQVQLTGALNDFSWGTP